MNFHTELKDLHLIWALSWPFVFDGQLNKILMTAFLDYSG